jgi:hypothetical protein
MEVQEIGGPVSFDQRFGPQTETLAAAGRLLRDGSLESGPTRLSLAQAFQWGGLHP